MPHADLPSPASQHSPVLSLPITHDDRRFALLADSVEDYSIVMLSPDGHVIDWNKGAKRINGYDASEIIGRHFSVFYFDTDREAGLPDQALVLAAQNGKYQMEVPHQRKDGSQFLAQVTLHAIRDEDGQLLGFGKITHDRTMIECSACALAIADENMRKRLKAEAANAAKTNFLATMSHEIRTPLTAISGYIDLTLSDGRISPAQMRHLNVARKSCDTLLSLINNILDFSKIESGDIELKPEPLSMWTMVDNVTSMLGEAASIKGLALTTRIEPDLPTLVLADEARLRQILLNLVNNAIKFTDRGKVRIEIARDAAEHEADTPDQPEQDWIRFCVTDTGIGISAEDGERLFTRFTQANDTISTRFGGSGLGLAICRQLVEAMGGAIGFESEFGRGSRFWFTLPLQPVKEVRLRAAHARADNPVAGALHLLLVEDLPANQEIARLFLEDLGYVVDVVDSGTKAIEAVQICDFDAVLMDIRMPDMDGLEATRRIRNLPGREHAVPIIAMTANVFSDDVRKCRDAGMNDHIGKPFDRQELGATLRRWTMTPHARAI